jgi:hypothetical protein
MITTNYSRRTCELTPLGDVTAVTVTPADAARRPRAPTYERPRAIP